MYVPYTKTDADHKFDVVHSHLRGLGQIYALCFNNKIIELLL